MTSASSLPPPRRSPRGRLLAVVSLVLAILVLPVPSGSPPGAPRGAVPPVPSLHTPLGTAEPIGPAPPSGASVTPVLHVSLSTNPKRGILPLPVSFSAVAHSRLPSTWFIFNWSFGDGALNVSDNISTAPGANATDNRTHTFSNPGAFNVTVRVDDSRGDTPVVNRSTVTVVNQLSAHLTQSRTVLDLGQVQQLAVSYTGGFSPVTVLWFGPPSAGCPRGGANVNCTATTNGTKNVTAWVNDSFGSSVRLDTGYLVNPALTLKIVSSSTFFCNGGLGQLTGNYTPAISGGTAPFEYEWNFDDGSPEVNESNVSHGFPPGRVYLVTLNVTDEAGVTVAANSTLSGGFSGCAEVTPPSYAPPSAAVAVGVVALAILIVVLGVLLFREPRRPRPAVAPFNPQAPPGAVGDSAAPAPPPANGGPPSPP